MDMDSCGHRRDPIRFTKESVINERSAGELITRAGIVRLQPQIAEKAPFRMRECKTFTKLYSRYYQHFVRKK